MHPRANLADSAFKPYSQQSTQKHPEESESSAKHAAPSKRYARHSWNKSSENVVEAESSSSPMRKPNVSQPIANQSYLQW